MILISICINPYKRNVIILSIFKWQGRSVEFETYIRIHIFKNLLGFLGHGNVKIWCRLEIEFASDYNNIPFYDTILVKHTKLLRHKSQIIPQPITNNLSQKQFLRFANIIGIKNNIVDNRWWCFIFWIAWIVYLIN